MCTRKMTPLRPVFHFTAPYGWINDPNGFCYFKGMYHLFYQYNPHGCEWSKMYWGHAVSKDLTHWEDLPIALYPDQEYDMDEVGGCFSGSAIVHGDRLYIFYTGTSRHGNMLVQSQCMAYSDDGIKFEKYSGNPVVPHPPAHEGEVSNFRDPKVIQAGDKYYMVVGSTTGGLKVGDGRIFLYVSDDLMHWQYKGILLKCNGEWTSMCECPDLFPLGNKWVLLFSLMHAVNAEKTVYAVGHMDFEKCRFTIESTGELDYGMDYYAAQTMLDPKGRRLVVAWQNSWEWLPWFNDFGKTEQENWRGTLSYPREISLGEDGKLRVYPVEELQTILHPEHTYKDLNITSERTAIALPGVGAYCLKIHINLSECRADVLKIGTKAYGDKATIISIDFDKCSVSLDRRNGDEVFIPKGKTTCLFTGRKETFEIMVLVDKCTVEFFINKGETGMTCTVFPASEEQKLWLQTENGEIRIEKLDVSEIHL